MNRIPISVYTDGSCLGNKTGSPGGWAAILCHPLKERVLRGYNTATTNNRMELTAVIEAVRVLTAPCDVNVYTDSTYVMMGEERWNRFMNQRQQKNYDLWKELLDITKAGNHKLHFKHVYGHTGDVMNERCDKIAKEQAEMAKRERSAA